ncbi:GspH/FimT family pseudopilin [Ferrimonas senticii]|uniref:GspH/FimT family pseudopilin n=1 Tax=Ferrimonas senticii TaxID=394566 RepID=UPI0003F67085|nr:GspH/FimT family pseudopilin [Ferrimonas senticii]
MRYDNQGLTLVEMLVTMVVAAILLAIAVPAMEGISEDSRGRSGADVLYQDLMLARQLAASYQNAVTICHLDGSDCDGDWDQGYTIFIDADRSNSFTSGDEQIQLRRLASDQDFLNYDANFVRFNADGSSINNGDFNYCPNSQTSSYSRTVRLASSGMLTHLGLSGSCS